MILALAAVAPATRPVLPRSDTVIVGGSEQVPASTTDKDKTALVLLITGGAVLVAAWWNSTRDKREMESIARGR